MSQHTIEIVTLLLTFLNVIIIPLVGFVLYHVRKLRENEIEHINRALVRIETKVDGHLHWHANGGRD